MRRILRKLGQRLGAADDDALKAALVYLALPAAALGLALTTAF